MVLQAFILLCSLAAVCFSALPATRALPAWAVGFVALLLLSNPAALGLSPMLAIFHVEASQAALLLAVMALSCLVFSGPRPWSAAFGGAASAFWLTGLLAGGFPHWLALPMTVMLPALAMQLARRRRGFYTARLGDEALVIVLLAALLLALAPEISRGWLASAPPAASAAQPGEAAAGMELWLPLLVALASLLLGALYRLYLHRLYYPRMRNRKKR